MNVTFNPNAAAHNPNARSPQTQDTSTTTAPADSGDGVEITLSPAAKQALKAGASEYTGNSPAHMARQYIAQSLAGASAEGADGPDLSGPFGQIVKTFAPGHNKGTDGTGDVVPEDGGDGTTVVEGSDGTDGTGEVADGGDGTGTPPADGGDGTTVVEGSDGTDGTGEVADGGDGTGTPPADGGDGTTVVDGTDGTDGTDDTGATDGTGVVEGSEGSDGGDSTVVAGDPDGTVGDTDPTLVVDAPDVTEVLDESGPAEGEVTEPESGLAGSGDAVASSGDDAPVDDGTPVDSGEPVTVVDTGAVDTGDVTDELLDLLNEGSEETV